MPPIKEGSGSKWSRTGEEVPYEFDYFHMLEHATTDNFSLKQAIDNEIKYGNVNHKYVAIKKLLNGWP